VLTVPSVANAVTPSKNSGVHGVLHLEDRPTSRLQAYRISAVRPVISSIFLA